jgi:hypothetical protein
MEDQAGGPKRKKQRKPKKPKGTLRSKVSAAIITTALAVPTASFARAPLKAIDSSIFLSNSTSRNEGPALPSAGPIETSLSYNKGEEPALMVNYTSSDGFTARVAIPIIEGVDFGIPHLVFPGPERTVILTDTHVLVTLGSSASFRGERFLLLDGQYAGSSTVKFRLPEDCLESAGGGIASAAATTSEDGSETVLYFANKDGKVRSSRMHIRCDPYSMAQLSMASPLLVAAGAFVLAYEEGSRNAALLRWTEEEQMYMKELTLPGPAKSAPSVSRIGPDTLISFGSHRVLLMQDDPLNPSSVEVVLQ